MAQLVDQCKGNHQSSITGLCFSKHCRQSGKCRLICQACGVRNHNHGDHSFSQLSARNIYLDNLKIFQKIDQTQKQDLFGEIQKVNKAIIDIHESVKINLDDIQLNNIEQLKKTIQELFTNTTVEEKIEKIRRDQLTDKQIDKMADTIKIFYQRSSLRDFQKFQKVMYQIFQKLKQKTQLAAQKIQNILEDLREDYEHYNIFDSKIKWERFKKLQNDIDEQNQTLLQLAMSNSWTNITDYSRGFFCMKSDLSQLKNTSLQNKQIIKIPEQLRQLRNLINLTLNDNFISQIDNLDQFRFLEGLSLNSNHIVKIKNLEDLRSLTRLKINDNRITKIEGLANLTNLLTLELKYNKIQKLQNLQNLQRLETLHLQSNEIKIIQNLQSLQSLKKLILKNNKIKRMQGLKTLNSLDLLSLSLNFIEIIQEVDSITTLTKLRIYLNPLLAQNQQIIKILRDRKCDVSY